MSPTDVDRRIVAGAAKHIGLAHWPYMFGTSGPQAYDCSGVAVQCWSKVGVSLPHNTGQQAVALKAVPASDVAWSRMLPGDLVFYRGDDGGDTPATVGHVAVFVETFQGMHVVAQATNTELGSELIRAAKYESPLFLGYVR